MTLPSQKFRCQSCCNWFTDIKVGSWGGIQLHNVYTKFEKISGMKIYSTDTTSHSEHITFIPFMNWKLSKNAFGVDFNINGQSTTLQHRAITNYWTLLLGSEWEGAEAVERQQPRLNLNFTQWDSTCRKVNWDIISAINRDPLGGWGWGWRSRCRTRLRTERSGFKSQKL